MDIIVQKYGGTSVADVEKIKNVARRVIRTKKEGNSVVVVVSALGDTTDNLLKMAHKITPSPPERELDMLLATGEQVSVALLAMAIEALGHQAISFTGLQVGILTDAAHTKAKIIDVKSERILKELEKGKIVIVAGFQGVTVDSDITTLGRGGSDTTAVALAAKLKADTCEIYTDVEGVFTADPQIAPDARKISVISYDEMLEMSATGAKVIQLRAVEYGKNYRVTIHVRSSFLDEPGTIIKEADEMLERPIISGVTYDVGEAKVTILDVPDKPGIAAKVFKALADRNVNVDMIIQNVSEKGFTDISFTVVGEDLNKAKTVMERIVKELGARGITCDEEIAKVSLIGAGMKSHPGVASDMFSALAENDINIEMISTSAIKISCVIHESNVEKAVRAIHEKFNLGKEQIREVVGE
ncbi:MAG: aspartate kinase [Candidatus Subteraquimicrobiales bacterium]|nr:aspartate kinase [Candidatus Subteraquimicrobiales bacterium]